MRISDKSNYNFSAIPIFFAFLFMGFGDEARPLVNLLKDSFEVSNFQAQLMTFSGFIKFGFVADQSTVLLGFIVPLAALLDIMFTTLQAARN
jgi:hypothetical protein